MTLLTNSKQTEPTENETLLTNKEIKAIFSSKSQTISRLVY